MALTSKKLVDCYRERSGRYRRSGKGGRCKNPEVIRTRRENLDLYEFEDEDTGETRVNFADKTDTPKTRNSRPIGWDRKEFGENLNPLWRYFQKSVGRNWDAVYSEVCQKMDRRGAVSGHIFDHLWDYVVPAKDVTLVEGKPHYLGYTFNGSNLRPIQATGKIRSFRAFWVDPRDGKLKRAPKPTENPNSYAARKRREEEKRSASLVLIGDGVWLSCHPETNLWYRLEYRDQEFRRSVRQYRTWNPDLMRHQISFVEFEEAVHREASHPEGLFLPNQKELGGNKVLFRCGSANKKEIQQVA